MPGIQPEDATPDVATVVPNRVSDVTGRRTSMRWGLGRLHQIHLTRLSKPLRVSASPR